MTSLFGSETFQRKSECKFIQLDIKELCPFMTEKTLNNVISFAESYISISKEDIRIIKHRRKSLLFYENEAWKKKTLIQHLMLQWVAMMVRNSASVLEYTISFKKYTFKRLYELMQRRWVIYST